MRIDSTHWPWLIGTLTALGFLTASFVVYAALSQGHARGSSIPGLAYGAAGYGLMLYAALLGLRKKVPVWRVGKAQTWMRGHLWMGFLSLPLILFHCAFTWKGPLASLLMILLFIVVGSGLTGAALQHYIPRLMTRSVPMETIYEEIPHVRRQLAPRPMNWQPGSQPAASMRGRCKSRSTRRRVHISATSMRAPSGQALRPTGETRDGRL